MAMAMAMALPAQKVRQRSSLSSITNNASVVEVESQQHPSQLSAPQWRHGLENLLWIASAFFIIYYGDFRSNLFALLLADPRIRRLGAVAKKSEGRLENGGAILAATIIGLASFILLCVGLWPIWNILTVPMLFTLFMALLVIAPYLFPYMNLKVDADSCGCIYVGSP